MFKGADTSGPHTLIFKCICLNRKIYLSKLEIIFVSIGKYFCLNWKLYLLKVDKCICLRGRTPAGLTHNPVWIEKYICLNWKSCLYGLENIFVSIGNYICQNCKDEFVKGGGHQPASHSHFRMFVWTAKCICLNWK